MYTELSGRVNSGNRLYINNFIAAYDKYPEILSNLLTKIYPYESDNFATQNTSTIQNGIFILIEKNVSFKTPIEIMYSSLGNNKHYKTIHSHAKRFFF